MTSMPATKRSRRYSVHEAVTRHPRGLAGHRGQPPAAATIHPVGPAGAREPARGEGRVHMGDRHQAQPRRGDRSLWGEAALRYLKGSGYTLLSMGSGPSAVAEGLSGHHPPPFARLLAAQALTEPLRVVPPHNPCWRSIKKGPSRS